MTGVCFRCYPRVLLMGVRPCGVVGGCLRAGWRLCGNVGLRCVEMRAESPADSLAQRQREAAPWVYGTRMYVALKGQPSLAQWQRLVAMATPWVYGTRMGIALKGQSSLAQWQSEAAPWVYGTRMGIAMKGQPSLAQWQHLGRIPDPNGSTLGGFQIPMAAPWADSRSQWQRIVAMAVPCGNIVATLIMAAHCGNGGALWQHCRYANLCGNIVATLI